MFISLSMLWPFYVQDVSIYYVKKYVKKVQKKSSAYPAIWHMIGSLCF
jgi:hypothetical protein